MGSDAGVFVLCSVCAVQCYQRCIFDTTVVFCATQCLHAGLAHCLLHHPVICVDVCVWVCVREKEIG